MLRSNRAGGAKEMALAVRPTSAPCDRCGVGQGVWHVHVLP